MNSGCLWAVDAYEQNQLSEVKVELLSEADTDATETDAASGSVWACVW